MSLQRAIVLAIAATVLIPATASAYNHIKAHPRINELAIERFVSHVDTNSVLGTYQFMPDLPKLVGTTILEDGKFSIVEGDADKTWREWIIDGGHTADEPEMYSALRHFYDPKGVNDGKNYLTDHVIEYIASVVDKLKWIPDPKMDALEWAIEGPARNGYAANRYAWNRGLEYMDRGFAETNPRRKQLLFAGAWRALGETMHLVADMTVPAHVRNDAHPVDRLATGFRLDPYEFYTVIDTRVGSDDVIKAASRNALGRNLADAIRDRKDVSALFRLVATHTNENYFSADTVAGKDESGRRVTNANGMAEYPKPRLDGSAADDLGYYVINGRKVAHVEWADGTWWSFKNGMKARASDYLAWRKAMDSSRDVAIAQAQELIPLAVEGGAKLVDWFIPRVVVAMTGYDPAKRTLTGKMTHVLQPNSPYSKPLVFNKGPTEWSQLIVDGRFYSETSGEYQLKIENGSITCTLGNAIRLDPGVAHTARMKLFLGGPWVASPDFKLVGTAADARCDPNNPYGDCAIGDKLQHVNVGQGKKAMLPTSFPECCRPHLIPHMDYERCVKEKGAACRAPVLPAGCKCDW